MNLSGISFLESLPIWDGKRLVSVQNAQLLLASLGNPQNKFKAIQVVGTNGKGSVSSFLSSIIYASGARVGQFSSPHLSYVTERCLINGRPVDTNDFNQALLLVRDVAAKNNVELSYFILTTVASFYLFAEKRLDWAVIEAGLGGIYDATNVIEKPALQIITNIALDHTDILGPTLSEVAANKAGIIRSGAKVNVGLIGSEAKEVISLKAEQSNADLSLLGREFYYQPADKTVRWDDGHFSFKDCSNPLLRADYQQLNCALAVYSAANLGFSEKDIKQGLNTARWPGRVEEFRVSSPEHRESLRPCDSGSILSANIPVIIDAAHNPDGMQVFLDYLRSRVIDCTSVKQIVIVLSVLARKDWQGMLEHLAQFCNEALSLGINSQWIITRSSHPLCLSPVELEKFKAPCQCTIIDDCRKAYEKAISISDCQSLVVITGSIFLLGEIRPILTSAEFTTIARSL